MRKTSTPPPRKIGWKILAVCASAATLFTVGVTTASAAEGEVRECAAPSSYEVEPFDTSWYLVHNENYFNTNVQDEKLHTHELRNLKIPSDRDMFTEEHASFDVTVLPTIESSAMTHECRVLMVGGFRPSVHITYRDNYRYNSQELQQIMRSRYEWADLDLEHVNSMFANTEVYSHTNLPYYRFTAIIEPDYTVHFTSFALIDNTQAQFGELNTSSAFATPFGLYNFDQRDHKLYQVNGQQLQAIHALPKVAKAMPITNIGVLFANGDLTTLWYISNEDLRDNHWDAMQTVNTTPKERLDLNIRAKNFATTKTQDELVTYGVYPGSIHTIPQTILDAFSLPVINVIYQHTSTNWVIPAPKALTLTLNPNGADGDARTDTYITGASVAPKNLFTRSGYQFTGWNTKADGTGNTVTTLTVDKDVTLYAQWRKSAPMTDLTPAHKNKYTLTVHPNYPERPQPTGTTVEYSDKVTPRSPERPGYTLLGYADSKDGKVSMQPDTAVTVTANRTLYAIWQANPSQITYDMNGGTGSIPDTTGKVDETVKITDKTPTRKGYTFVGWNTKPDGSGEIVANTLTLPDGGLKLYAQWKVAPAPSPAPKAEELAQTGSSTTIIAVACAVLVVVAGGLLLVRRFLQHR